MYALNFKTRLPGGTGIYAEYSYRPNQPIAWNGSDFITGLLAGNGPFAYLAKTPPVTWRRVTTVFESANLTSAPLIRSPTY